ncbi:P27 family phage terminase small subunit [Aeoliella sp.]|uniref:P27 family phage terminase small subunit n=1 Tax=Aeoliella sp. TaxID=2795800 RepID=UPI003CCB9352
MKTNSPKWLGTEAKKQFQKLIKDLPELTAVQLSFVEIMADSYETYRGAAQELAAYAASSGSFNVPGSQGQVVPHPALKIIRQGADTYSSYAKLLLHSIRASGEVAEELENEVDDLMTKVRGLTG